MNTNTRISHSVVFPISHWSAIGETQIQSNKIIQWSSKEKDLPGLLSCIATFEDTIQFNCIEMHKLPGLEQLFPDTFRFEISVDGKIWEPILYEVSFSSSPREPVWHFPLVNAKYLKILILNNNKIKNNKYVTAFGKFEVKISGLISIEASSEVDRLWVKENLVDTRPDYGWSSGISKDKHPEFLLLDLGSVNEVNEIRLLSSIEASPLFPERFGFSYSADNITWHHLLEENAFLAESQTWYTWKFMAANMRFLRIDIIEGARNRDGKYVSQLVEVELFAVAGLVMGVGGSNSFEVKHASSLRSGIVRLGMDGEDKEGVVVQGNDRRLKCAQEGRLGIVEFATSGEVLQGKAVQGNDRRLEMATEDLPGIVRLARNGENREGHAVQGDDDRLKLASLENAGIVELAANEESRAGVVIQGNDNRLKQATIEKPGIVRLAKNLATNPNEVVQGDDFRLKDADTQRRGIVQLASHGASDVNKAVQADDPRLQEATSENAGIVKVARDGESSQNRVLHSSDRRLQEATSENAGIVKLAAHSSCLEGYVVQSSDPRLTDKRDPKDHQHDYASTNHRLEDHDGLLHIKAELGDFPQSLSEVAFDTSPVFGDNKGKGAGVMGRGTDGIVGKGENAGVLGINIAKGVGVQGLSRFKAGGHFVSETSYGLIAGGGDKLRKVDDPNKALLAIGESHFQGSVSIQNPQTMNTCIAMYYFVSSDDVVSVGDLLIARGDGQELRKSKTYGAHCTIGVVTEKAALIVESGKEKISRDDLLEARRAKGQILVAISGIVEMNVCVERSRSIEAGDLLVTSSKHGFAEKMNQEKYKPGMIVGRSLCALDKGEAKILVQLITL